MQKRGRRMLWLVLLVCASPLLASYFTYYVLKPEKRNNYGALVDQRAHPVPAGLGTTTLDGRPQALAGFKGKWVMLMTAPGACAEACRKQLFTMRQLRLMQGKEMDRIERVWLITDRAPLETLVIREFDGTHMLRADPAAVQGWLPVDAGTGTDDHIYLIDPLGHLMMRFPRDPEPRKVYKDIYKLLKASSVG
ncbi:cytochrome C oxidase subunit I [uncultured Massilia sp.]|uniref:SCO family protein n=1 Tax=uncultured Massilia sp. TaxID=169973 RepID=UPI0025E552B7|nr:cytochrome C oxidase subunit I [uncultured Massilia sp.]